MTRLALQITGWALVAVASPFAVVALLCGIPGALMLDAANPVCPPEREPDPDPSINAYRRSGRRFVEALMDVAGAAR